MSDRQSRYRSPMEHTSARKGSDLSPTPSSSSRSRAGAEGTSLGNGAGNGNGNNGQGKLVAPFKALIGAAAKIAEEEASAQRWMERIQAGRAALQARCSGQNKPQRGAGLNEEATQCSISELSQLMEDVNLEDEEPLEWESADEQGKGKKKDDDWVVVQEDFDVLVFLDDG